MLIRIIQTTYGYRPILPDGKRSHYVIPVRPGSAPIEVEQAEAERLISIGVAEEVKEMSAAVLEETAPAPVEEPAEMNLEEMSFNELKTYAQGLGIETGKLRSKASMIEAINHAETEAIPFDDLPDLTAEDFVD